MAEIDVKFMKGDRKLAKAIGNKIKPLNELKKPAKKSAKKSTSKKK